MKDLIPDASLYQELSTEEVALTLMLHLNSPGARSDVVQHGMISRHNYFNRVGNAGREYGDRQDLVDRRLMEGWAWLESNGFLIQVAGQPAGWFFASEKAKAVTSREAVQGFRQAFLLQRDRLHPDISKVAYSPFVRGAYADATFAAFRQIEIRVANVGGSLAGLLGRKLMDEAFKVPGGPLTDMQIIVAEQESMRNIFNGSIGLFKNPPSHRHVATDAIEAAELVGFASYLMRILDRLIV